MTAQFFFSDVVVVEDNLIGVVVKSWGPSLSGKSKRWKEYNHDIYVRSLNGICTYPESEIKHFVYSKELSEEELEYYE